MKDEKKEVVEPNQIANIKGQKISKAYLDVLHIALSLVAEDKKPDKLKLDYEFYIPQYKELYGLDFDAGAYRKLRMAIHNAMAEKAFLFTAIDGNGNEIDFYPFQEIRYIPSEYKIHIVFTSRFKEMLCTLLEKNGEKIYFALTDTLRMKSEYSKKFYPILLEYKEPPVVFSGQGCLKGKIFQRIDTYDDFCEIACIPKSYSVSRVKDVCAIIQDEINSCTPYTATVSYNQQYGPGRYGGKISHVCWTIASNVNTCGNNISQ